MLVLLSGLTSGTPKSEYSLWFNFAQYSQTPQNYSLVLINIYLRVMSILWSKLEIGQTSQILGKKRML